LDERTVRRVFEHGSEGAAEQAHIHHNGSIKIANRNGRDYSFPALRARMLLNRDAVRQERAVKQPPPLGYIMYKNSIQAGSGEKPRVCGIDMTTMTRLIERGYIFEISTTFAG